LTDAQTAISPASGPIAVTGASGFIGSWIVLDLVQQGYRVRACIRDETNPDKVEHLLAMNHAGNRGEVELHRADLHQPGSYDAPFKGCAAVIHAGAAVGYNRETPQEVYDGCFTEVGHLVESVKNTGTVSRLVFTSSFAAVGHPRPEHYIFTEHDWCGDNPDGYHGAWNEDSIATNRDIAYAMAKARTEKMIYQAAEAAGSFEAMAILPLHVIGPLMCSNHDQSWSWQNCIKFMLQGKDYRKSKGGRMLWNNVDVRDVARAHRLCAESTQASNGSRYILAASDRSGELFTWQLQEKLQQLFPEREKIGGEEMIDGVPASPTYDSPRAYSLLAREELGLDTYSIDETLRATGDSYHRLGMI
jgi:nucleoside-diphosphate-sugar epimerase